VRLRAHGAVPVDIGVAGDRAGVTDLRRALIAGLMGACVLLLVLGMIAALMPRSPVQGTDIGLVALGAVSKLPPAARATVPKPATTAPARARAKTDAGWRAHAPGPNQPTVPAAKGALPVGKGMWLYNPVRSNGGVPLDIVHRAQAVGLTHLFVRVGSSHDGFYAQDFLNRLLPVAHANGIRVYGWDFPYLDDWSADVARAVAAITYRTPDGQALDGFTADIETRSEGVNITPDTGRAYGILLRQRVGNDYPLIATVPRPSPQLHGFPFAEVVEHFDAIAPMIYWLNREPGLDTAGAFLALQGFHKPIMPVGQAYDGGPEGGRPGVPPPAELERFMQVSSDYGAPAVSFWSWQAADQPAWDTIRAAGLFTLPVTPPAPASMLPYQIRSYQTLLTSLGFPVPITGAWDPATVAAVSAYQKAARLPITGSIDLVTRDFLLHPFAPPIRPLI
jgi:hypothetical protein